MSLSLLLVEDKPATQAMLMAILAETEFVVTVANDGLDGLNHAKHQHFDIVVVDHKMPLMDGLTLCKNLRELSGYLYTPILFLTTQDVREVQAVAKQAGADLCLAKPVDAERLLTILADLTQGYRIQPQTLSTSPQQVG
ncbi:two-component system response regulator [Pseudidiomarina aestuarii]|uniref:Two-component system response regulator n=1 Tax=Pseudidiomarina aestuarii TaxID=624146 RepID=A0A2T4CUY8_9GAMM|nr:two-component system response regulator [Pseudidiomarina aestuarii]PTB89033.1 two-component system response regulator [Pseudidiomarina aestuarii]PTB89667.1 two-component system response regulator [Pseudidiomarina aestuarii]